MGERLSFYLSLGLFSSFGVDAGTMLLLKTLAQKDFIPSSGSILDAGCGTGTIAVSIKKRFPSADVTAVDRDALALRFTKMNAQLNKLPKEGFQTASGLLPGSIQLPLTEMKLKWDLIISNIPAKAGNPVIKDFLQNCGLHLNDGGRAAVVIVAPLAEFAEQCLKESGAQLLYKEADKQYSVFHFIPRSVKKSIPFPQIYERTAGKISGFFGLPEFDSISYCTQVTLEMLDSYNNSGNTLIWNPGTGHIACRTSEAEELYLAGTDLLQLKASGYNLGRDSRQYHLPTFSSLTDKGLSNLDYLITLPVFIQGAEVEKEVLKTSEHLLRKKGKLLIAGKSSDIARIEKNKKGFLLKHSIKYRGFRSILLEKQ